MASHNQGLTAALQGHAEASVSERGLSSRNVSTILRYGYLLPPVPSQGTTLAGAHASWNAFGRYHADVYASSPSLILLSA